jgi:hypothetical protein
MQIIANRLQDKLKALGFNDKVFISKATNRYLNLLKAFL